MKKKITLVLSQYWHIVVIFGLALAMVATVNAEFTRSEKAKRVIAAYSSLGSLFSSNFMIRHTDGSVLDNTVYSGSQSAVANVKICNYAQENPDKMYSGNIVYTLKATITDSEGNAVLAQNISSLEAITLRYNSEPQIYLSSSDGINHSFTQSTLTTNKPEDICVVTIPNSFIDSGYGVTLEATPVGSYDNVFPLAIRLVCARGAEANDISWSGSFVEDSDSSDNYYGYNYTIIGSGTKSLTLRWANSGLTPNKYDLLKLCNDEDAFNEAITNGQVSFVASDGERYDIRFFGKLTEGKTLNNAVTCE